LTENSVLLSHAKPNISIPALRKLLALMSASAGSSVRYRLMGEMWQPNFMRVLQVTDDGVVLVDESKNRFILLSDLNMIMQFELDSCQNNFDPYNHYDISRAQ
jgi:hypothetical protein